MMPENLAPNDFESEDGNPRFQSPITGHEGGTHPGGTKARKTSSPL